MRPASRSSASRPRIAEAVQPRHHVRHSHRPSLTPCSEGPCPLAVLPGRPAAGRGVGARATETGLASLTAASGDGPGGGARKTGRGGAVIRHGARSDPTPPCKTPPRVLQVESRGPTGRALPAALPRASPRGACRRSASAWGLRRPAVTCGLPPEAAEMDSAARHVVRL